MRRRFDDLMLGSIELFCLAAELKSFTAAAAAAGVSAAAVSRSVARLEARLGVRLFARSTRRIGLTEAGERYFARCRDGLTQLLEAERDATGRQAEPSGLLRVSLPTSYGHHRVLPLVPEFRERFPAVRLDLHLSNRNVDFAAEGFDLAIRAREPADSGLTARRLEDAALVVVAAPAYLQRHGRPERLEDLAEHECVQFLLPSDGRAVPWVFRRDGADVELPTRGALCCAGDVLAGATLARAGAGLCQTYRFVVERDLAGGALVEVLAGFGGRARPFSLLYPHGRLAPLKVRCFADFLLERLRGPSPQG